MLHYFENNPMRASRELIGLAAASGVLSYIHGACGAILLEADHPGLGRWLGSISLQLCFLTLMATFCGGLLRSAWAHCNVVALRAQGSSTYAEESGFVSDDVFRFSNVLLAGGVACCVLAYLHGSCGGVMEEFEYRWASRWLDNASTGLFLVGVCSVIFGGMTRGAESQLETELLQRQRSEEDARRQQLSAGRAEVIETTTEGAEQLRA
ncbi:MAG: hypothetical protein JWN04_4621 [Myxococcaceae bacterium]|nr:hypothetical protein [Myxococcaceae bacterium]